MQFAAICFWPDGKASGLLITPLKVPFTKSLTLRGARLNGLKGILETGWRQTVQILWLCLSLKEGRAERAAKPSVESAWLEHPFILLRDAMA